MLTSLNLVLVRINNPTLHAFFVVKGSFTVFHLCAISSKIFSHNITGPFLFLNILLFSGKRLLGDANCFGQLAAPDESPSIQLSVKLEANLQEGD